MAGSPPLPRVLNSWFWLGRSVPGQNIPSLGFLMHITGHTPSGSLRLSAISAPVSIPPGSSLPQIQRQPWRLQPETIITMIHQSTGVNYHVQETGFDPQQLGVLGIPDLEMLMSCLFGQTPYVPSFMNNVHSLSAILSGLLTPSIRQRATSLTQSSDIFTPDLVIGRRLEPAFFHRSPRRIDHFLFTTEEYYSGRQAEYTNPLGQHFLTIGATPHTGSCSVFHWGQEVLVMTLDAAGRVIMLASHRLLLALRWFSGQCKPQDACARPEEWDPDNYGRQVNSLPIPRRVR